jgi:hypothetical protein
MAQTATVCGGFAEDPVVQALVEGEFGDTLTGNDDTAVGETWAAAEYAATLRHLVPGCPTSRSWRRAPRPTRRRWRCAAHPQQAPTATKILAFDGSFHGRALLVDPRHPQPGQARAVRAAGYEATFAPFPVWTTPGDEPAAPSGFYAACAAGQLDELVERFGDAKEDPLLAAEVASLAAVHAALGGGEHFCVTVEPMQSEGGDRYATERFFRALRLLTRYHDPAHLRRGAVRLRPRRPVRVAHQVPPADQPRPARLPRRGVLRQAGPGRRGDVALRGSRAGQRAQRVLGARAHPRRDDVDQRTPRPASRSWCGRGSSDRPRVPAPGQRAAGLRLRVRVRSADAGHLDAFIGQRFWRGAIVFAAGTKTARYRLADTFGAREIELLFDAIRRSLSWIDAHPGKKPPEWEDIAEPAEPTAPVLPADVAFRLVPTAEAMALLPAILDIEYQVYEPARRTPPAEIKLALDDARGLVRDRRAPGRRRRPARRLRDRRAARGQPRRRGPRSRPDAGQAQHHVLGVGHRRARLSGHRHRPQAEGAAAPRRREPAAGRRHRALRPRHRAQPRRPHRADDPPEPGLRRPRRQRCSPASTKTPRARPSTTASRWARSRRRPGARPRWSRPSARSGAGSGAGRRRRRRPRLDPGVRDPAGQPARRRPRASCTAPRSTRSRS